MNRKKLVIGASALAGLFLNLVSSYADISGYQAKTTGNNPHSWNAQTLTNIVQNASNVPEEMTLGIDPNKSFLVGYDFSGSSIDFSNTNSYFANICGGEGTNTELYAVGTFSTIGQGFCQFYFGNSSLSNPSQVLTNGTPLRLTVIDNDSVYALDTELKFIANEPNTGTFFTYNSDLNEKIGTILKTLTVNSAHGTPNPGTVEVYPGTTSTQTIESVISGPTGIRYVNTGSSVIDD